MDTAAGDKVAMDTAAGDTVAMDTVADCIMHVYVFQVTEDTTYLYLTAECMMAQTQASLLYWTRTDVQHIASLSDLRSTATD